MECLVLAVGLAQLASVWAQEVDELAEPWADNCETMDPGNHTAQQPPSPYQLILHRQIITAQQGVYLTIRGNEIFRAFMVQARDKTGESVGEFDLQYRDVSVINCFGREDSTAMHADFSPKREVRLRWAPETEDENSVTFYMTIAQQIEPVLIYWTQKYGTLQITKAK